MSYVALYRKFRPAVFDDVRGQDPIVNTLKNQLKMDRVGHAYLFTGTRGTGKTSVAKILARAVNCRNPKDGNPCNECESCRESLSGSSLNVLEIDAASNNGVDNVRDIREEVQYPPARGKYKVYIVDEVHMLSTAAFNALLKTLEEPPAYVIFILATTEVQKIPATILSRCQRYDFHRISTDVIADRMKELLEKEGEKAEERAVRYIARAGDGSMRDALSLLDRCISFYPGVELTYENVLSVLGTVDFDVFSRMLRLVLAGDVSGCIGLLDKVLSEGKEPAQFTLDFTWYLRNLLLVKASEDPRSIVDASEENMRLLVEESGMVENHTLMRYIRILSELSGQLGRSVQKRVLTEMALIRLCRPQMDTDTDSLLERIRILEKKADEAPKVVYRSLPDSSLQDGRDDEKSSGADEEGRAPKAEAPKDFQTIAAKWKQITGCIKATLGQTLRNSEACYNGETGEPVLYVVLKNNDTIARLHAERLAESDAEQIQEAILEVTGLRVDQIRLTLPREAPKSLEQIPSSIDEAFASIHTEIEPEDQDPINL